MVRGIRLALGSPLTPALSPLRGEGAQVMPLIEWKHVAAFETFGLFERIRFVVLTTRQRSPAQQCASNATPSPLNGERAGVRGEDDRTASSAATAPNRTSLRRVLSMKNSLVIASLDIGHSAPVANRITDSSLSASRWSWPVMRPWHITSVRSLMRRTSSISLLTKRIATPRPASSSISR